MYQCLGMELPSVFNKVKQPIFRFAQKRIRKEKEESEKCYGYDDHDRGGPYVPPRGPVHLPHFDAHIVKESAEPLERLGNFPHRRHQGKTVNSMLILFSIQFRR